MDEYDIEDLVKIFKDHATRVDETPTFGEQKDFNLPKAFMTICKEILELKEELEELSNQYYGYDP